MKKTISVLTLGLSAMFVTGSGPQPVPLAASGWCGSFGALPYGNAWETGDGNMVLVPADDKHASVTIGLPGPIGSVPLYTKGHGIDIEPGLYYVTVAAIARSTTPDVAVSFQAHVGGDPFDVFSASIFVPFAEYELVTFPIVNAARQRSVFTSDEINRSDFGALCRVFRLTDSEFEAEVNVDWVGLMVERAD